MTDLLPQSTISYATNSYYPDIGLQLLYEVPPRGVSERSNALVGMAAYFPSLVRAVANFPSLAGMVAYFPSLAGVVPWHEEKISVSPDTWFRRSFFARSPTNNVSTRLYSTRYYGGPW